MMPLKKHVRSHSKQKIRWWISSMWLYSVSSFSFSDFRQEQKTFFLSWYICFSSVPLFSYVSINVCVAQKRENNSSPYFFPTDFGRKCCNLENPVRTTVDAGNQRKKHRALRSFLIYIFFRQPLFPSRRIREGKPTKKIFLHQKQPKRHSIVYDGWTSWSWRKCCNIRSMNLPRKKTFLSAKCVRRTERKKQHQWFPLLCCCYQLVSL